MNGTGKYVTCAMVEGVFDALRLAQTLAGRGSDVHSGEDGVLEFNDASIAIDKFMSECPQMVALRLLKIRELS